MTISCLFSSQDKQESPKSSKLLLPRSAFVPVGGSSVLLKSSSALNPPVIGITQVTVAGSVVKPGGTAVQVAGGRTSPVIIVAPNQLQSFGAQIIMLPSPNSTSASATPAEKTESIQKEPEEANDGAENNASKSKNGTIIQNSDVGNTISLPETSTCSPDGEALLDKLDMMDTDGEKETKNQSGQGEVVDLHELTAYLTHGQDESVVISTSDSTQPSESVATVLSGQEATSVTTVVTTVDSLSTVTQSLGFNPISPAEPKFNDQEKCASVKGNEGNEIIEIQTDHTGQSENDKPADTTESVSIRPSSREGLFTSIPLHSGSRSRPNSRGAAPSPGVKQTGGFVQLGEHTRDSPNIYVSIQNQMPLTGKINTVLYLFSASKFGQYRGNLSVN